MTFRLGAALAILLTAPLSAQSYRPPAHTRPPPPPFERATPDDYAVLADWGAAIERERPAGWALAEHRKLARALAGVQPGRKGVVEAFVVSAALDSDPVFGREAREAGKVLGRRYAAQGRTIVLAGTDGAGESALPMGSPAALAAALGRVAEAMQREEDVLVLYATAQGGPFGMVYNDGDTGYGALSPYRLWTLLRELGLENRLLIVSACYSGVFVPLLKGPKSVVVTAASYDRTSFGCVADNDWTFFGDALINQALRKPAPLAAAFEEARALVGGWEARARFTSSNPQISVGADAGWLAVLDARAPKVAGAPVGRPAIALLPNL
jgi:hypothetical protein